MAGFPIESPGGIPDDSLVERWIEPNPHRPGVAEAIVRGTGVPVWALVGHSRHVRDLGEVARDYDLPSEAVAAALAYYQRHKAELDQRLAANAA